MRQRESTIRFTDSYHSTKCIGAGNGRKQSTITARARRQVNKKRRVYLQSDLNQQIIDAFQDS